MLYKRSSFIKWLTDKCHCEVSPLPNNHKVLMVKYLNVKAFIGVNINDEIDYEEIYMLYQKLLLPELPGDKDLVIIE